MFTGIVEHIGRFESVERLEGMRRFRIDLGPIAEGVKPGDSIAVAGCCLTVTEIADSIHTFEAIPETLAKTRLGGFEVGDPVNLERAMGAAGRFDGHIVQGHVDGIGRVRRFEREGIEGELHVECDAELAAQLVDKGSVTIDGVSLTVVAVVDGGFHVALIPHTLEVTTLAFLGADDLVNMEVDVLATYGRRAPATAG
ncbi:MAG: riboflavin synthase, partial [Phycisphaeraceae bacterium]|nr:riboflavin synthase [Phycisphaeraceae bacterium]